jgi:hypothetical protein
MSDVKITKIQSDLNIVLRNIDGLVNEIKTIRSEIQDLKRELGVREGKYLAAQIDNIEIMSQRKEALVNQIARDSTATRKLVEYNENHIKEIMRALALIYRSVDELEAEIVPNNKT